MSLSSRSRKTLKSALRSNSAGNDIADAMGGRTQITEIQIPDAVEAELKEVSQLVCPAVVAADKEISQLICLADASVKEISQLICPAHIADVKEITDLTCPADAGVKEITDITSIADTSVKEITQIIGIAEGSVKEITQLVCDTRTNSVNGEFFDLTAQDGTTYRVAIDTVGTSAATPPTGGRDIFIEVDISGGADTAANIGDLIAAAINAEANFSAPATGTGTILITDANFGAATDADGGTIHGTGLYAVTTSAQGVDSALDGKYFTLYDDAGTFGVWIDVGNSGTSEPGAISGYDTKLEIITITAAMTNSQVADEIYDGLVAHGSFEAGSKVGSPTITVKNAEFGARTTAVDGDTTFTITRDTAGVDSNLDGTYFILEDEVGTVGFWFDIDNSGTSEPGHGADRSVEITTVSSGDAIGVAGTAIYGVIIGDSKFEAGSDDAAGNLTVRNAFSKAVTGQSAGTSPLVVAESTPGVDSNYDGLYFILQDDVGSVAFWFDSDSRATTEPSHGADRGVEIATVTIGMTAGQAGTAIYSAVTGDGKFEAGTDDAAGNLTIQASTVGAKTDGTAGTSPITVAVGTPGTDENYDGKYFIIYDEIGSVGFWFDLDDSGTGTPGSGAAREVEITTVNTGMSNIQAATAIYAAIIGDSKFEAGSDPASGTILVQSSTFGAKTDISQDTSPITVSVDTAGVDSNYDGKYFIMQDDAGSVGFWFDLDDSGTIEPGHGADRGVEINTISAEDTAGTAGTAIYTAIIGDSKFEAGSDDTSGTLLIQNADAGVRPDVTANTSDISVSVTQQGSDNYSTTYILLYDDAGSVAFWFDIDDAGQTIPSGAGTADRAVEVETVNTGMTNAQAATALYAKITGDSEFEAVSDTSGTIVVRSVSKGVKSDIDAGTSNITVSVTVQGLDAFIDGQYIILQDEIGSVAFWIDVDNAGTAEPSHGAARAIEVTTITSSMTVSQAISALYTVITGDSKFVAGVDAGGGFCLVQSSTGGARSGQSSSVNLALVVTDTQVGADDGATLSDDTSYILRIALARTSTEQFFLEIKAAIETGTGTSLSTEALRSLKILISDKKTNTEVAALYA